MMSHSLKSVSIRWWLIFAILVLIGSISIILGVLTSDPDRTPTKVIGLSTNRTDNQDTNRSAGSLSSENAEKYLGSDSASSTTRSSDCSVIQQPCTTGERIRREDLQAPSEYANVALSLDEALWMNEQGVPRSSSDFDETYEKFSMRQLESMAMQGDANAARIGAVKAMESAIIEMRSEVRQVWQPSPKDLGEMTEDEAWSNRQVLTEMYETPAWKQRRHLLWLGVVHGSSIAAERMTYTYGDGYGRCYFAIECDAWTLVAWRMGNWDTRFSVLAREDERNISLSMRRASSIWSDINDARFKLGLRSLDINVRPNFKVWAKVGDGGLSPPIYWR